MVNHNTGSTDSNRPSVGWLKMREWKMRYSQNCRSGKCKSGKRRSKPYGKPTGE